MTHANVSRNITETSKKEINKTIKATSESNSNKDNLNKTDEYNLNITKKYNDSHTMVNSSFTVIDANSNALHSKETKVDNTNLLKYVHKKNDNIKTPNKSTGSFKNKLKRKRRSSDLENLNNTNKPPAIVNYETLHPAQGTLQRDGENWLLARNTANVIKNSDLADFNIETLHENNNEQSSKKYVNQPFKDTVANPDSSEHSNENSDKENYTNNKERYNKESGESNEKENESSENGYNPQKSSENYSDAEKRNEGNDEPNTSTERDSNEDNDSREYSKSKYSKSPNSVDESVENYSSEIRNKGRDIKDESSEEPIKYKSEEDSPYKATYESNPRPLGKIIDVDLGEYEKIVVNKNGKVETAKDYHNKESDTSNERISAEQPSYTGSKVNDKISLLPREGPSSSNSESVEHDEPTHINDGEVKPVVEINTESDSNETSDENADELNAKLENESLETLTGVNEKDSDEKSDKLQDKPQNNRDVKQQFERIPLNYNHAASKHNKDTETSEENSYSKPENNTNDEDEGTLDKLKPRYDEQLNIKFDDIHIKLPEIKLPDDILSYAHEDPPTYNSKDEQVEKPTYYQSPAFTYQRDDKKQEIPKFYHYSDEVQDDTVEQNDDDDDNTNTYGNTKKNNAYTQKEKNVPEDEDLYEKFVKEKFGKRGTFKKRLEKLTHKAYNPLLYEKVQNILKKTEDVKSQAAKSGDPNAAYMWTLEYGDKL